MAWYIFAKINATKYVHMWLVQNRISFKIKEQLHTS